MTRSVKEIDTELRRLVREFERLKLFSEGDIWSVQVDDLMGGWVVTDYPHPLSEHDHRPDNKMCYDFAFAFEESNAWLIASLLNRFMVMRPDD